MLNLEKDLIDKVKKGDDKAFGLLFQNNYTQLCVFAKDILRKSEIAEEIVQDVFIKLWNSRDSINISSSVRGYLFKMVRNHSLNYIRDNSTSKIVKEEKLDSLDTFENLNYSEISDSIMDNILSDEAEKSLNESLLQLPEQCREIFISCRFEGLTYPEIAQKYDISLSTVKTQMGRAMEKLHAALKKYL